MTQLFQEMNMMHGQPIMPGDLVGPATIDIQNQIFGALSVTG
jgi:hypothetical protein